MSGTSGIFVYAAMYMCSRATSKIRVVDRACQTSQPNSSVECLTGMSVVATTQQIDFLFCNLPYDVAKIDYSYNNNNNNSFISNPTDLDSHYTIKCVKT